MEGVDDWALEEEYQAKCAGRFDLTPAQLAILVQHRVTPDEFADRLTVWDTLRNVGSEPVVSGTNYYLVQAGLNPLPRPGWLRRAWDALVHRRYYMR